jgi:heavy metal sensor kinase
MFDSVRLRLTLWYVCVLSVILIAFSVAVYVFVERNLYERVDASLYSTFDAIDAGLKNQSPAGGIGIEAVEKALQGLRRPNQAVAVLDAQGKLLAEYPAPGGFHVRLPPLSLASAQSRGLYSLAEQNSESDDSCRGVVGPVQVSPGGTSYMIVVNQSLEPVDDQLDLLQNILYLAVPAALLLAGLGGWFLARRSLQPVAAMSARAQRISAENLDERLPIGNPRDELGRLAAIFNELLARLGKSFSQQRQFMADASHELRTPLSVIRTTSAVTLQRTERHQDEYREALAIVEQQARRLSRIVEDMFVLARADAHHPSLQITEFYLDELVAETVRGAAVLASQKAMKLAAPTLSETPFRGDEGLLRQMMWNLLDNAIKFTPKGGAVSVTFASRDSEYVITVADTGDGIAPEIQPHIFERFYRADRARSRTGTANDGGAGLGLPIARWIAQVHGGRLELRASTESGSTFEVFLPLVPKPMPQA